jgi:hypothetical protein
MPATKEGASGHRRERGGTEAERSERLSLVQESGEESNLAIASMLRIRKEGFQKVHSSTSIQNFPGKTCLYQVAQRRLCKLPNPCQSSQQCACTQISKGEWTFQTGTSGTMHTLLLTGAAAVPEAAEPGAAGG